MFTLTLLVDHDRRTIEIPADQQPRLLTDVLRRADLPLNTRCGQRGLCEGCTIQLKSGCLIDADSSTMLQPGRQQKMLRGCRLLVPEAGAAEIHIPLRSLLAHRPQIVTSFRINVPRADDPLWQHIQIDQDELPSDIELGAALCRVASERRDQQLPVVLRTADAVFPASEQDTYDLALAYRGDHWQLGPVDVSEPAFGVAIDIGTTTVVVALVELATGHVVGSESALNAQTRMGDNVLTRINLCMRDPTATERLQRAVIRHTLRPLVTQALRQASISLDQLACAVVAGNTTMLHLLAGTNPASMGVAPFTATFLDYKALDGSAWKLNPQLDKSRPVSAQHAEPVAGQGAPQRPLPVHLLPGSAAYVGADITAGVLACAMAYRDATSLLVDLGTNGELVLKHRGKLVGCATAAGPAFEGEGLKSGLRAGDGAISHLWLEQDPLAIRTEVIGNRQPVGICGTAYIDLVSRARQIGLISPTGRIDPQNTSDALIQHETHGRALVVADGKVTDRDAEGPLIITEADIASLLQAKAAIGAGIVCLLRRAGLQPADVETVYLAGGFGFHMHIDSLIGCGMLPGFQADQVELVGNTALAGAYLTLLDSGAMHELQSISRQIEIVELNLEPDFEGTYIEQLTLP